MISLKKEMLILGMVVEYLETGQEIIINKGRILKYLATLENRCGELITKENLDWNSIYAFLDSHNKFFNNGYHHLSFNYKLDSRLFINKNEKNIILEMLDDFDPALNYPTYFLESNRILKYLKERKMKDFLGKELKVEDKVVVLAHQKTSSTFYKAEVIAITEKKVKVKSLQDTSWQYPKETYKDPNKVVKVDF